MPNEEDSHKLFKKELDFYVKKIAKEQRATEGMAERRLACSNEAVFE